MEEERRLEEELEHAAREERRAETFARTLEKTRRRVEKGRARFAWIERRPAEVRKRERPG